jgi:hypothetical protein
MLSKCRATNCRVPPPLVRADWHLSLSLSLSRIFKMGTSAARVRLWRINYVSDLPVLQRDVEMEKLPPIVVTDTPRCIAGTSALTLPPARRRKNCARARRRAALRIESGNKLGEGCARLPRRNSGYASAQRAREERNCIARTIFAHTFLERFPFARDSCAPLNVRSFCFRLAGARQLNSARNVESRARAGTGGGGRGNGLSAD